MYGLERSNALSREERRKYKKVLRFLAEGRKEALLRSSEEDVFACLKAKFGAEVAVMKEDTVTAQNMLHYLFAFVEEAFEQGNEMLILVTELTVNNASSRFLASFPSPDYQRHNQELMLSERRDDIKKKIGELGL